MKLLLQRFIAICLFKARPQDLPFSGFLLALTIICYSLVNLGLSLNQADLMTATFMVLVDLLLLSILTYLLLWMHLQPGRYQQTLTALAGGGTILALVAWPLLLWQQQTGSPMASMFLSVFFFWNLAVFGHIIRHALSTHITIGILLALLYMYLSYKISAILFIPETAT